ncbi:hypothetical protein [Streptomyces paromomycinus]|uniref:Membrane protein n=1 Tax=Streptomyces paromomycinus TaxID=92743 RepID=A0A401VXI4_STREY|nr:hypothetical protein [Streptomyces paromomycinus]GCD41794.1 membrane protein [Streptomyces paromomycinus]
MVHVSLVVALLAVVWFLIKKCGLKAGHAVAAILLGFYLRDTHLATPIERLVTAITQALGTWRL